MEDKQSIFYHYQRLIKLRKQYDIIVVGQFELLLRDHPHIFAYLRFTQDETLLVVNNFYGIETLFTLPENIKIYGNPSVMVSNYGENEKRDYKRFTLRPYESIVFHFKDDI